jgi:hypothetical protein
MRVPQLYLGKRIITMFIAGVKDFISTEVLRAV